MEPKEPDIVALIRQIVREELERMAPTKAWELVRAEWDRRS